ncbi:SEC10/PgrA surface exclusion domain-containing protein, partial [Streptococcus ovis]
YPVSVSNGSVSMVDEITDMYVAHDFLGAGHYNAAINQVAQKYGLPSDATNESQVYENLNTYGISSPTISMAQAKEYVYNSIVRGFLFNGFEYGHALSILGLHDKGTEYVAVDVSSRTNATSVHFIFVPTVDANRSAVFDQNRVKK